MKFLELNETAKNNAIMDYKILLERLYPERLSNLDDIRAFLVFNNEVELYDVFGTYIAPNNKHFK